MKQLNHYETKNNKRKFPITIVCDAIRTPENIGMCFRVSESFGVQKIYLHKSSPLLKNRTVIKTARNTINYIKSERYDDFLKLIKKLKQEENTIIGIEITKTSINIKDFDFSSEKKITLLLGSERNGIENLSLLDATVSIPMYGRNSSINVVNSLAIALYEISNQLIN